jgi:hypothetical protein
MRLVSVDAKLFYKIVYSFVQLAGNQVSTHHVHSYGTIDSVLSNQMLYMQ